MHIIATVTYEKTESNERLPQDFFVQHPLGNRAPPHVNVRLRWSLTRDAIRALKIIVVMATASTKRECNG